MRGATAPRPSRPAATVTRFYVCCVRPSVRVHARGWMHMVCRRPSEPRARLPVANASEDHYYGYLERRFPHGRRSAFPARPNIPTVPYGTLLVLFGQLCLS